MPLLKNPKKWPARRANPSSREVSFSNFKLTHYHVTQEKRHNAQMEELIELLCDEEAIDNV